MFAHRSFRRAASSSARFFGTKSRPNAARPFADSKPTAGGSLPNVAPAFLRPSAAILLQAQQLLSTTPTLSFMTAAAGSSASGTPLSSIVEAGDADLEAILNGANGRVLVDFYAPYAFIV